MRNKAPTPGSDAQVARLARRDHGVLSTSELLGCGLTRAAIHRRVRARRLHPLFRGVYAVGHLALGDEGRWLAALKAAGPEAVLSHQSAAELWELTPHCPGPVHLTVPAHRHPRPARGISAHRSKTMCAHDVIRRGRIPVTTPSRTLRDLKRVVPRERWEAAVDRARVRGFPVAEVVDEEPTRSGLERRFLRLCRRHRLPAPEVNVRVDRFLVDFLWPERRLVVEVDGYEFHRARAAFDSDRARDAELAVLGYRVLRFTYRHVTVDEARVVATLRQLLIA